MRKEVDSDWKETLKAQVLEDYERSMKRIRAEFHAQPENRKPARDRSALVDRLITQIRRAGVANLPKIPKMAVMAVGGYGRGELFFHSDIDLMFVVQEGQHEEVEPLIQLILHLLWDLKLKVGHSVRTTAEAVDESLKDMKTRTNLLEARRVVGSRKVADFFTEQFTSWVMKGREQEFIEAKLLEWRERHQKFGDSRALLEPNVKEGKGGLRDLQTLMWLMRACYGTRRMADIAALQKISDEELRNFRRARRFLHLVRLHLHDIAGRAEERLTFDAQRQIAERLGYRSAKGDVNQSVERFMKRYFQITRMVGQLSRTVCVLLEEEWGTAPRSGIKAMWKRQQLPDGLSIIANRLHFKSPRTLESKPKLMIGIFWFMHRLEIDIHPAAWQMLTRNLRRINASLRKELQANEYFLQLLLDAKNPAVTLKRMNEAGVLGKFIPDFGLLAGQMQFDLYHTLTVDEHILTGIGYLHRLEAGEMAEVASLATTLFPRIQMRRVTYLALFCHDIAKGRGGDHHLKGVAVGMKLAKRFGFDESEQAALAWLIEYHQHMSMVAFKRDLDDPQTIESFAEEVKSPQLLKMLYVMTIADIHAVAPNIWNSWKGGLLEALYRKTERALGGVIAREERSSVERLQSELEKNLPQVNPNEISAYIDGADGVSLEAYDIPTHARILPCWQVVQQGERFGIRFKTHEDQGMTQVTIATADSHGLFAQIAGVFAICGANIIDARIYTRRDGIVIDRFAIQDSEGGSFAEDRRQERIRSRLHRVLSGELDLPKAVEEMQRRYPSKAAVFTIYPKVFFDNDASATHTLLEIQCIDRRGLLYRVTNALAELRLSVSTAHIATYGEKVVDVFYIKDGYGHKIVHWNKLDEIKQRVLEVLG